MSIVLGRQPIVDREQNVVAYDLLSRSGPDGLFSDHEDASRFEEIADALPAAGFARLLGQKPAFVKFDEPLLLGERGPRLPSDQVVIEIDESIGPTPEILSACESLRDKGYVLALGGCRDDERTLGFLSVADIFRVDFQMEPAGLARFVHRYKKANRHILAERVETWDAFGLACRLGCDYAQGYFFTRPQYGRTRRVPPANANAIRLIRQIQQEAIDIPAIEEIIHQDVALSYSLLRYLNSAVFVWESRIESVRQAIILLGDDEIRQWGWMAAMPGLGQRKSHTLMTQALFRGRFCELMGLASSHCRKGVDTFLLGIASLFDAIREEPLAHVLAELNLSRRIQLALTSPPSDDPLSRMISVTKAYERGDWDPAGDDAIGLKAQELHALYLSAINWVDAQAEQFGRPVQSLVQRLRHQPQHAHR